MFDRFTHIINGFKGLGKIYPKKKMVKKMLNSLTSSWEAKVTTRRIKGSQLTFS
ncbi:hypothetical protein Gotur_017445 [Gossypium turneri]